jgi:hypothetical protein
VQQDAALCGGELLLSAVAVPGAASLTAAQLKLVSIFIEREKLKRDAGRVSWFRGLNA